MGRQQGFRRQSASKVTACGELRDQGSLHWAGCEWHGTLDGGLPGLRALHLQPQQDAPNRPVATVGLCLGLSNSCPQAGGMRTSVARDGQVSDNPKHKRTKATGCYPRPENELSGVAVT